MLESWVVDWINEACGKFLKRFDEEHVNVSITGNIYLTNIEVNIEAFGTLLNLPFEPVSIFIGEMHIDVPILPSSDLIVNVSDVLILCAETVDVSHLSAFLSQKALQKLITLFYLRKEAALRKAWANALKKSVLKDSAAGGGSTAAAEEGANGSISAGDSLAAVDLRIEYALGLLKRLHVSVQRMHVRLEDSSYDTHCCPRSDRAGSVMALGVLVHSLQLVTSSAEASPGEVDKDSSGDGEGPKGAWPDTADAAAAEYDAIFRSEDSVPRGELDLQIQKSCTIDFSMFCSREKSLLWALTADGVYDAKKKERKEHGVATDDDDDDSGFESDASTASEGAGHEPWDPRTVNLQVPMSTKYVQQEFKRCTFLPQNKKQEQESAHPIQMHSYFHHIMSHSNVQAVVKLAFSNSMKLLAPAGLDVRISGVDFVLDEASTLFILHLMHQHLTFIYRLQRRCKIANAYVPKARFLRYSSQKRQKHDPTATLQTFKSLRAKYRWKLVKQCVQNDWFAYTASLKSQYDSGTWDALGLNPLLSAASEANKLWSFVKTTLRVPGGHEGPVHGMKWRSWFNTWRMCGRYIALRELLLYHLDFAPSNNQDLEKAYSHSLLHERLQVDWCASESGDEDTCELSDDDGGADASNRPATSSSRRPQTKSSASHERKKRKSFERPGSRFSRSYRGTGSISPDNLAAANFLVQEHLNRPNARLSSSSAPHIQSGPLRALYALQLELDAILPPVVSATCRAEANDRFRAQRDLVNKLAKQELLQSLQKEAQRSVRDKVTAAHMDYESDNEEYGLPSWKSNSTDNSNSSLVEPASSVALLVAIADCAGLPASFGMTQVQATCTLTLDKGSHNGLPHTSFDTAPVYAPVLTTSGAAHVIWSRGFGPIGPQAGADGVPGMRSLQLQVDETILEESSYGQDRVMLVVSQSGIFAPVTFESSSLRISDIMGSACKENLATASAAFISNTVYTSAIEDCSHNLSYRNSTEDRPLSNFCSKTTSQVVPSVRLFTRLVVYPVSEAEFVLHDAKIELEAAAAAAAGALRATLQEAEQKENLLGNKNKRQNTDAHAAEQKKSSGLVSIKFQARRMSFTYGLTTGNKAIFTPIACFFIAGPCMWVQTNRNPYAMDTRMSVSKFQLTLAGNETPLLSLPAFAISLDLQQVSSVGKYIDSLLDESCFKWTANAQMGLFSAALFQEAESESGGSNAAAGAIRVSKSGHTSLYEYNPYKNTLPHLSFTGASSAWARTCGPSKSTGSKTKNQHHTEYSLRLGSVYEQHYPLHLNVPESISLESCEAPDLVAHGKVNRRSECTWHGAKKSLKLGVEMSIDVSGKQSTRDAAGAKGTDIEKGGAEPEQEKQVETQREKGQEKDKTKWSREQLMSYIQELEAREAAKPPMTTKESAVIGEAVARPCSPPASYVASKSTFKKDREEWLAARAAGAGDQIRVVEARGGFAD